MKLKPSLALVASAIFLTACGGGSDSVSSESVESVAPVTPVAPIAPVMPVMPVAPVAPVAPVMPVTPLVPVVSPSKAEGYYVGNYSTTTNPNGFVETLVLENDDIWVIYGTRSATGIPVVTGMLQGKGLSNNGEFYATDLRNYTDVNRQSGPAKMIASYVADSNFIGNVSFGSETASFTAVAPTYANYNFKAVLKLEDIVGSWTGSNLFKGTETITIKADGTWLSGSEYGPGGQCISSMTGIVRPSDKSIFDLSLFINGGMCGSSASTGYVMTRLLADGRRQLIAMGTGGAFIAVR